MSFDLLTTVESGGCSAKLPAGELNELLKTIPMKTSEKLLVGADTHDDASVWKINDETAIIQTTDFFPALCSDPYEFGQIAAANSLSDVYAMGGEAITALNLVMFPSEKIPMTVLQEILKGGADKALEAGVCLTGGHTINDYPPKYGMAVTGTVHPDRIISNAKAEPSDLLLLTKAIGTGVIAAGHKLGEASTTDYQAALESMKQLNMQASGIMQRYNVQCATDITGFGLLGHAYRMAEASGVQLTFNSTEIPLLSGAYDLLELGCIPGACFRNLKFVEKHVEFVQGVDYNRKMMMVDAQTSGGLLICCKPENVDSMKQDLIDCGYQSTTVVGGVSVRENDSYLKVL